MCPRRCEKESEEEENTPHDNKDLHIGPGGLEHLRALCSRLLYNPNAAYERRLACSYEHGMETTNSERKLFTRMQGISALHTSFHNTVRIECCQTVFNLLPEVDVPAFSCRRHFGGGSLMGRHPLQDHPRCPPSWYKQTDKPVCSLEAYDLVMSSK